MTKRKCKTLGVDVPHRELEDDKRATVAGKVGAIEWKSTQDFWDGDRKRLGDGKSSLSCEVGISGMTIVALFGFVGKGLNSW